VLFLDAYRDSKFKYRISYTNENATTTTHNQYSILCKYQSHATTITHVIANSVPYNLINAISKENIMANSMSSLISNAVAADSTKILTSVAAVTAATAAIVGWMMFSSSSSRNKTRKNGGRRWSCMSESMAHGCFPPKIKFDEAIINAVLVFDDDDRPSVDEIVEHCVTMLLGYDRFSSIFDRASNLAHSKHEGEEEGTTKMDPYDLVRVIKVTDCLTEDDILKKMEDQACVPLADAPRGHLLPWWEFVLFENTSTSSGTKIKGKSAVIWRIHHSLGDGISLVQVVEEMFFNAKTGQKLGAPSNNSSPVDISKKFQIRRSPFEWIFQSIKAVYTVLALPISKFDDPTMFHETPISSSPHDMVYSSKQAIIPFRSISLEFVKRLKNAASMTTFSDDANANRKNVTVNDVLFTVVSQALHDYLKEEKDTTLESKGDDLMCRTLLPVALPRPKTDDKSRILRNMWCFISCDLSVGTSQILDRLWKIHDHLSDLKKGLVPMVSFILSNFAMKWLPRTISRDQTLQLFSRHSMVLSNVPGPSEPVSFANHEVKSVQMIHMNLIPQLAFLSYRGMIFGNAIVGIDDDDSRCRERLPLHVSNALVLLASKLEVNDVPESLRDHAAQL
jgi:hypothetical protein